jgi:histidine triad (HIT) family protein
MQRTIFEKIIAREVSADIVYEDDAVLAFLDIKPINHGHTLIVPKVKFENIFDANPEVFAHMAKVAQRIAVALREVTSCDGVNLTMNNGSDAGQEIFHAHIHVIPRFHGDEAYRPAKHLTYDKDTAEGIVKALTVKLA